MATIQISSDPNAPSRVDIGETPITKTVTLAMGDRTAQALVDLVNERRALLKKRVSDDTPVVGPVESVEEALLDTLGGIGASGGSDWFYQNFVTPANDHIIQSQLQAIDHVIGSLFAAIESSGHPTPYVEQLHWLAKKVLRQPVKGVQYAFAEEPSQPEGVTSQQAFARSDDESIPEEELERAKNTLEGYRRTEGDPR